MKLNRMKWNGMKYTLFSKIYIDLQQFQVQVTPENKTQMKVINYLIFMISNQNWAEKSLMDKSIGSF